MPQFQFEGLTQSLQRLPQVIQSIPDIVRDPSANPLQAVILLAVVVVLVLVVLLSVVLVVMRPSPEDEELYGEDGSEGVVQTVAMTAEAKRVATGRARLSRLTTTALILLVFVAVWVAAGITTGSSSACNSCHTNTSHASAKNDPHASVACVDCHESGGPVARATVNLGTRIQHVILAQAKSDLASAYGKPVSSDACKRCHSSQIAGISTNKTLGVRVSHKEALAAGAECIDCHTLSGGSVNATTVGMSPCLRCHDGKAAKATCSTCHTGDPSLAIQPDVAPNEMAAVQVPNPQCSGCHTDMTVCNKCHGISMPHSETFMEYAHARPAAIDIWFGSGNLCAKCHYPGHNNCVQQGCHAFPIPGGHPNPAWATMHQNTSWSHGPDTACSCHHWNPFDHNGMIYCQICHPTKPKNAVP